MTTRYVLASCILFSCLGSAASVNAALTWSNQDTRCNGNQRIDYARLWGLNFGTDWIGICKRTKADKVSSRADGKTPSTCVQKADGSVWGEWKFSKHVSCKRKPVAPLTWGNVGHKCENAARIEYARLWGLRPGTDWTEICRRTKANKISQLSDGKVPSACVQKVDGSVWGEWKYSNHASCTARWGNFKKDHCVDIGHRQWSSRIWEQGSDPMLECGRTPAVVGGQHFAKPDRCKNLGAGGVWGEFDVKDVSCPFWGNELRKAGLVHDDCSAVNIRKHYARLWDIAEGVEWNRACHAVPATIGGHSRTPSRCVDKGPLGMWGEWLTEDKSCTIDKLPQDERRQAIAHAKLEEIKDSILTQASFARRISENQTVSRELGNGDPKRVADSVRAAEGDNPPPESSFPRTITVGAMVETKLIFIAGTAEAGVAIDTTGRLAPAYAYASAGYAWGPALAAGGGINIGFWVCQANQIGGDIWGWTFGLDDIALAAAKKNPFGKGANVAVGLWFSYPDEDDPNSQDKFQGFTITPGFGVGADFAGLIYTTTAIDGDETVTCDGRPAR
ncbi:MAG: hypothetical protein AB2777_22495 [Candidatus Thiodiazotropha endolucinida]